MNRCLLLLFCLISVPFASSDEVRLLRDFSNGWRNAWTERAFTSRKTVYRVVRNGDLQFLRGESNNSASGLWCKLDIRPLESGTISWKWNVEHGISNNRDEHQKKGDDYAARVFVVFKPQFFNWKTRSLCYVWASREPVNRVYPSPYANNVGTFVLQSGDRNVGLWIEEHRDLVSDYKRFFKNEPEMISAVAFMVDTDNTQKSATASITDIVLNTR